jgi:DNA-binding transcriptional regulator YhcF (GntR family)
MARLPLYERIESVLAGDIADGSLLPEAELPSGRRLGRAA